MFIIANKHARSLGNPASYSSDDDLMMRLGIANFDRLIIPTYQSSHLLIFFLFMFWFQLL